MTSKSATSLRDWANVSISSDVSAQLDYSKVDFKKFSPSSLDDINDLNFATLGKNYKKLKWDDIDYSTLNDASKEAIDWAQVDLKKQQNQIPLIWQLSIGQN